MYTKAELETYACDLDQLDDPCFPNRPFITHIITIHPDITIEQINNIPNSISQVRFRGKLTQTQVQALPPHIHTVIFDDNSSADTLLFLPDHIECLMIYAANLFYWLKKLEQSHDHIHTLFLGASISREAGKEIPEYIEKIGIVSDTSYETGMQLPPNKDIILTPSVTSLHLHDLPQEIKQLIFLPDMPDINMKGLKTKKVTSVLIYFSQKNCSLKKILCSLPKGVKNITLHKSGSSLTEEDMIQLTIQAKEIYVTADVVYSENNQNSNEQNDTNEKENFKHSSALHSKEEDINNSIIPAESNKRTSTQPTYSRNKKQKLFFTEEQIDFIKNPNINPFSPPPSLPLSQFWPSPPGKRSNPTTPTEERKVVNDGSFDFT